MEIWLLLFQYANSGRINSFIWRLIAHCAPTSCLVICTWHKSSCCDCTSSLIKMFSTEIFDIIYILSSVRDRHTFWQLNKGFRHRYTTTVFKLNPAFLERCHQRLTTSFKTWNVSFKESPMVLWSCIYLTSNKVPYEISLELWYDYIVEKKRSKTSMLIVLT